MIARTLVALLPVVVLFYFINKKDEKQPEPMKYLLKAVLFGVFSVFASFIISLPMTMLGLVPSEPSNIIQAAMTSFFGAAIPEEFAKLFMLWLVLRRNPHFDEKMDGIVYAVCISMGFAGLENIFYLFGTEADWVTTGIVRAVFSVPGHFAFGVLMGYYYSMVAFYPQVPKKYKVFLILAPILAHGIFDSILFSLGTIENAYFIIVLFLLFVYFCFKLWCVASKQIQEHLERDGVTQ